ncbi:MAG: hypothetical protein S0880_06800 [Actinomycetota bacterium]|nr:hypothetical protein [Actinomycetota bacterium]
MNRRAEDLLTFRRRSALFGAALGFAASVALLVVLAVGLGTVDIGENVLDEVAASDDPVADGSGLAGGRLRDLIGGADGPLADRLNERLDEAGGEVRASFMGQLALSAAIGVVLVTATGAAAGWWHGGRLATIAVPATTQQPRSRPRR